MNSKLRNVIVIVIVILVSGFVGYSIGRGGITGEGASVYGVSSPQLTVSNATVSTDPSVVNPPQVLTSPWWVTLNGDVAFPRNTSSSMTIGNPTAGGNNYVFAGGTRSFVITPAGGSPTTIAIDSTPTQLSDYGSGPVNPATLGMPVVTPHGFSVGSLPSNTSFSTTFHPSNGGSSYTVEACVQMWGAANVGFEGNPLYYVAGPKICGLPVSFTTPAVLSPSSGSLGESCNAWLNGSNYGSAPLRGTATEAISSFNPSTNYPGNPFTSVGSCAYHTTNPSLMGQSGNCTIKPSTFTDSQSYPTASCTNNITTTPPPLPGHTTILPHGPAGATSAIETIVTMIQGLHD